VHLVERAKLREINFEKLRDNFILCKKPKMQKIHFFQNFFEKVKNGHKKVCPKFKLAKKFPKKKIFFYHHKSKNFFLKMRAFSRKITFLTIFCKNRQKPVFLVRVLCFLERIERGRFLHANANKKLKKALFFVTTFF